MRKTDNVPPSCAVVTKSGNLNFLEPSGPVQACNGTDLPLPLPLSQCPPLPSQSSHCINRGLLFLWSYPFAVSTSHDKRVPVTTKWPVLTLRMEERPPLWRVAANMLKKSRGQSTRGDHPTRFLGEVLKTPPWKKLLCYKTFHDISNLAGCCEFGNEPSGSMKFREFLD